MKNFIKEFKEFALKGNVFDLAVGIIIGGAIGAIVKSLVENVITPIIGLAFGGQADFSALMLGPVKIGLFINEVISFLILAFVLFLIIKAVNKLMKKPAPAPAGPSNEEVLLTEIRDLLKK